MLGDESKKVVKNLITVQLAATCLFVGFLHALSFRFSPTAVLLSFGFLNVAYVLSLIFRKTYSSLDLKASKRVLFELGNFIYSATLAYVSINGALQLVAFGVSMLRLSSVYPLFLLVFSIVVSLYVSNLQERLRREKVSRLAVESYLRSLKSQLSPHFLFNVLNAVAELVRKDPNVAEDALLKLSEYYRFVLNSPQVWSLADEVSFIESYVELQRRILVDAPFEFTTRISGDLSQVVVPAMILQPLVENAIRHGIRRCGGGFVELSIDAFTRDVSISVVNNVPNGHHDVRFGAGLSITAERVRLALAGSLSYESRGGEIEFRITFQKGKAER